MPVCKQANNGMVLFWCPGCESYHGVRADDSGKRPNWKWNGSVDAPTFEPSILVNKNQENPAVPICHSFVRNGEIQFLNDCSHSLAGQTVKLPDMENI